MIGMRQMAKTERLMTGEKCGCGDKEKDGCAGCGVDIFPYWCESCKRSVPDKRCPYCGLKSQRKRVTDGG